MFSFLTRTRHISFAIYFSGLSIEYGDGSCDENDVCVFVCVVP